MKMAKASEADLRMALTLSNYLDAIDRNHMPDALSEDPERIEWIDTSNREQYERLIAGLRALLDQGSIGRVILGMAVVCDPKNKLIDPDADTLELHPDLATAQAQRDEALARVAEIQTKLAFETQRADDAWANTRTIEKARQEEMRKRDAAMALLKQAVGGITYLVETAGGVSQAEWAAWEASARSLIKNAEGGSA